MLDGVLGTDIAIELVCQWSSPLAASELWYRFLNIGKPMPATGGTDMFASFYRAPAIGTARSYLPVGSSEDKFGEALQQARAGRGFVSTGPALLFEVGGRQPGDTVEAGRRGWSLETVSVRPIDKIEIIVNGKVVETLQGFSGRGRYKLSGTVELPEGGWIAARAVGGETGWPVMSFFHFAHTAPVWIDHIGSVDPGTARASARDLLAALTHSESEFAEAYGDQIPAGLVERIYATRNALEGIVTDAAS